MAYTLPPANGMRSAFTLPIVMIRPPSPMWRAASWAATNTPRTFTATIRSKSSSENWSSGATIAIPALLTSTSTRPKARAVSATAVRTAAGSALSACSARARPPAASMARTTSSAFCRALAKVMATAAPSAASRCAIAAPIPRDPPVTRATLPASCFVI
jgi:hypothetical protein